MVVYFSWSGNTRAYAQELAAKKGLAIFELKELKERKGKMAFIKGCIQGVIRKKTAVAALPDLSGCNELFLCSPIWASGPAPATRYFIDKADLANKKVHLLFTYSTMTELEEFKSSAKALLENKGCVVGDIYTFKALFKQPPDMQAVKRNISETVK